MLGLKERTYCIKEIFSWCPWLTFGHEMVFDDDLSHGCNHISLWFVKFHFFFIWSFISLFIWACFSYIFVFEDWNACMGHDLLLVSFLSEGLASLLLIYDLQSEDWINTYYMLKGFLKARRPPKVSKKMKYIQMKRWHEIPRIPTSAGMCTRLMWIMWVTSYMAEKLIPAPLTTLPPHQVYMYNIYNYCLPKKLTKICYYCN